MAAASTAVAAALTHASVTLNGLAAHSFVSASGSTFTIYEHGCTMCSFKDASGVERLHVSPSAVFDGNTAVRGGIPLVFPQFGPDGPLPNHGFARTSAWNFAGVGEDGSATFELVPTEATRAIWDSDFRLQFTVTARATGFTSVLQIANTGAAPFEFQALQHTYHALDAAEGAEVTGLEGMDFFDKLDPSRTTGWPADKPVVIDQEFDGIFMRNKAGETRPDPIKLAGRSPGGKSITVQAWATTSTAGDAAGATEARLEMVVWNPWVEKSKTLRDLPDDGYKAFICLEPGRVAGHATLEAGHEFVIHQVVDYE